MEELIKFFIREKNLNTETIVKRREIVGKIMFVFFVVGIVSLFPLFIGVINLLMTLIFVSIGILAFSIFNIIILFFIDSRYENNMYKNY